MYTCVCERRVHGVGWTERAGSVCVGGRELISLPRPSQRAYYGPSDILRAGNTALERTDRAPRKRRGVCERKEDVCERETKASSWGREKCEHRSQRRGRSSQGRQGEVCVREQGGGEGQVQGSGWETFVWQGGYVDRIGIEKTHVCGEGCRVGHTVRGGGGEGGCLMEMCV